MSAWGNVILYTSRPDAGNDRGAAGDGADCMRGPMLSYGALCNREVSARGRAFFERAGREVRPRVGTIWFVSMPMFGCRSNSVRLCDRSGEHILSVYLGRDRAGEPDAATVADFQALWEEFGVTPVPRNCCRGKRCFCPCACGNGRARGHSERVA